ncbi:MAG: DUF4199 domain-containing protein [Sphingobacteriales bacterium]|nr:MAG: DUF4199 domain-containing protein [Sphingobacteriales bacterium]
MENMNKISALNGLFIAGINIAIQIIVYYSMPEMFGKMYFSGILMVLNILIYVFFTLDLKKKVGQYWPFKIALKTIFTMALVANTVSLIFTSLFYKFIEPGAYDKIIVIITDSATSMYEKMGMSEDLIEKALKDVEKQFQSQYNPSIMDFIKSLAISILLGFVMSLIFAAIFKKNPPMFKTIEEETLSGL